jgi:L-amino acid N-acyltransferase YncA
MALSLTHEVEIVEALPEHLDAILALNADTCATHNARRPPDYTEVKVDDMASKMRKHFEDATTPSTTRLLVYLEGGTVVGHVFMTTQPVAIDTGGHDLVVTIQDISVLLPKHREGVGTALLSAAVAAAKACGATQVVAYVWFDNVASDAMFAKSGFSRAVTWFKHRLAAPLTGPMKAGPRLSKQAFIAQIVVQTLIAEAILGAAVLAFVTR